MMSIFGTEGGPTALKIVEMVGQSGVHNASEVDPQRAHLKEASQGVGGVGEGPCMYG